MRCLTFCSVFFWSWLAGTADSTAQSEAPTQSGNIALAEVLRAVQSHTSVSARLRHQARLFQHTQVGSGYYWQEGTGDNLRTHWEMKTQIAGKTASYVQVFDGKHLWTDRRWPSGRQVRRLDLARLESRLPIGSNALELAAGQGGLAQMLTALIHRFDFQQPRPTQLGGKPAYAFVGQWRPEQLLQIWPDAERLSESEPPAWPQQIPHHALILVGQNKFPYLLEQRRQSDAYLANSVTGLRPANDPLLRYEIFEVQFATAIDPSRFTFKEDVPWKDETASMLERLQAEIAPSMP